MEGQAFYWLIMTADDSIKCRCANSAMTGQVGNIQNPGVCLQAFPSFLSHPFPVLLLAPFVAQSLTPIPRSLLLNRTETLATQATVFALFYFSGSKIQDTFPQVRVQVTMIEINEQH